MAFPTIAGLATSREPVDRSSHTVALPSGIQVGDLLVAFFCNDGPAGASWPAGWTEIFSEAGPPQPPPPAVGVTTVGFSAAYRVATGSEGSSITVVTGPAESSSHFVYRITGHEDPTIAPLSVSVTNGQSIFPDPPALSPAQGLQDYLFLAAFGWDSTPPGNIVYPSGYTLGQAQVLAISSAGVTTGGAGRQINTSSQNPGVFSWSGFPIVGDEWVAATISILGSDATPVPLSATISDADEIEGEASSDDPAEATIDDADRVSGFLVVNTTEPAIATIRDADEVSGESTALSSASATIGDADEMFAEGTPIVSLSAAIQEGDLIHSVLSETSFAVQPSGGVILSGIVCGMAVSPVGLANMALTYIGEEPILSFTEDNKPARFICQHYDNARQYVLRQHPWGSATKRATLAKEVATPEWGFASSFVLPADFLRLNRIEHFKGDYSVENGRIFSDEATMRISYVYDLEDVSKMDPLLQQAIAHFLASELAIVVTQNQPLSRQLFAIYKEKLAEAQHVDVVEGPIEVVSADSWVTARYEGDSDEHLRRGIEIP